MLGWGGIFDALSETAQVGSVEWTVKGKGRMRKLRLSFLRNDTSRTEDGYEEREIL